MTDAPRTIGEIASYHAHVYYDPANSRVEAEQLRQSDRRALPGHARALARRKGRPARSGDVSGGVRERAASDPGAVADAEPWAAFSILVHPEHGQIRRRDHLADPLWIGTPLAVHGDKLPGRGRNGAGAGA